MFPLSRFQAAGLVTLRTLIGWHFLYEGYYKLSMPGWSKAGAPLTQWSAAGYLKAASGPFASFFHALAASSAAHAVDLAIPLALVAIGLSLTLGLLTRVGLWGAVALLTAFYLSAIPTTGVPVPGQEGTYLIVSKNLIELAAVLVLLAFHTDRIAGLDLLWTSRRQFKAR